MRVARAWSPPKRVQDKILRSFTFAENFRELYLGRHIRRRIEGTRVWPWSQLLSRRDRMIIARHFNAGKSSIRIRPEGTVEPGAQGSLIDSTRSPLGLAFQPSLRDSRHWRCGPRVKTRGYYQVSLRDKCGQRFGGSGKHSAVGWERAHFGRSLARRILSCTPRRACLQKPFAVSGRSDNIPMIFGNK